MPAADLRQMRGIGEPRKKEHRPGGEPSLAPGQTKGAPIPYHAVAWLTPETCQTALSGAANLCDRFSAGDEFPQQRQEKRFAEATEGWLGLEVKRPSNCVTIELVENDPQTPVDI
jgi:hypothetical protein